MKLISFSKKMINGHGIEDIWSCFFLTKGYGHVSMRTISELSKLKLLRGLPKVKFDKDRLCAVRIHGKHVKSSFKLVLDRSTPLHPSKSGPRSIELYGQDLFLPTHVSDNFVANAHSTNRNTPHTGIISYKNVVPLIY